jgi:acetyl-CoA carboxylase biotin carboxyl carrier protein
LDIKDIKDLILTIDKTKIQRVEIEKDDIKIMIDKNSSSSQGKIVNNSNDNVIREEAANVELETSEALDDEDFFFVKSPIVGVYYGAPSPDSERFVKIGDKVEEGQTLCIIEAMKIMNEIECEVSGEIVEIYVKDEDVIQYGQSLMKIRR